MLQVANFQRGMLDKGLKRLSGYSIDIRESVAGDVDPPFSFASSVSGLEGSRPRLQRTRVHIDARRPRYKLQTSPGNERYKNLDRFCPAPVLHLAHGMER